MITQIKTVALDLLGLVVMFTIVTTIIFIPLFKFI